ncbi:MAG: ImmA/IrrE family metallo-endopeptidase [Alphaproteobacteria bacterium]
MTRVAISPDMLQWARERAGMEPEALLSRFAKYEEWEAGETQPTLKQLENFAKAVHVPMGYLFLPEPPHESLPIPDFRTLDNRQVTRPSPNLLDMLYNCQERQAWYKEFAQITRQKPLEFIGSVNRSMKVEDVANQIRHTLKFDIEERSQCRTWEDALRLFIQQAEEVGILVMVSGVVLSNNNRKLDTQEFRGFALSDHLAPLVFINGSDSKSGQMFTLAHELAHLWLNSSGVSNASAAPLNGFSREEVWCNAVAAELLVPLKTLKPLLQDDELLDKAVARLSKHFKVSTLVILRRLLDAKWLSRDEFDQAWQQERARLREIAERSGSGGDFYRTTISRVSRRFTQAIVTSTLEGQTLYRDAFRMLGVSKTQTFNNLGREVGVML